MLAELGIEHLGLFVLSGWLLNLTPGPDVLYIVSSALRSGVRAGIVAALGITAGCFVHIVAAGLGVSALMATSAMAFSVLKWVGAAYLLYVGVRLLLSRTPDAIKIEAGSEDSVMAGGLKSLFFRGFWTNALNPKVALFFLAFVPQFITPGAAHPTVAFLVLGVLFNLNAIPINIGYAVLAAWAAQRTAAIQRGMHWLDRLAGALFVGFGIKLALSAAPKV
ncbi:LysE family translocator [Rhodoferax sp. TBRC 17660]|uniref:LysE family translocator n=1 Tax=Rhodoferax potami TaxID=3068338 RepID=A0ABU3KL72_9BURK|nr:LysE family translocator [Rhodoferax sp. TBRC 17660]MDT7518491.1 LysE family translocator [Rhodoferax sp. TBRC 17660]